jgi:GNAT superfamily N-acetyltransferase
MGMRHSAPTGTVRRVIDVRRATAADAEELMRLRVVMLTAVSGSAPTPGPWLAAGAQILRAQLGRADPPLAACVVDDPDVPGRLSACAVGSIETRLPGPRNPSGRVGYVYNVATDPAHRRRGYSRACMQALLQWYADQGVTAVDLRASREGEPLYSSLGFARVGEPGMRRTTRGH